MRDVLEMHAEAHRSPLHLSVRPAPVHRYRRSDASTAL